MSKKDRKRQKLFHVMRRKIEQYGFFYQCTCPECGDSPQFHYDRYDAACCLSCNIWLEQACGDPKCAYCANRPETPLEALFEDLHRPRQDALQRKTWRRLNYQHKTDGKKRHEPKQED